MSVIFLPRDMGLNHTILFSTLIISAWITLFFSALVMFRWEQSKLYWSRGSAFKLMPCDLNYYCILSYQMNFSMFSKLF